jgi:hypothetical protein
MSGQSQRDRFEELLNTHLDGDTSGDEELRKLIAADRELFREFSLAMTAAEGLHGLPDADPPVAFADRVMDAIETRGTGSLPAALLALWRRPALRLALAGALVALALVAGYVAGWHSARTAGPEGTAAAPAGPGSIVKFVYFAPQAGDVRLVGDFNRWNKDATRLSRSPNGWWTVEVRIEPGRYNYLFFVDGREWSVDPSSPAAEDDGFGRRNSVLEI